MNTPTPPHDQHNPAGVLPRAAALLDATAGWLVWMSNTAAHPHPTLPTPATEDPEDPEDLGDLGELGGVVLLALAALDAQIDHLTATGADDRGGLTTVMRAAARGLRGDYQRWVTWGE